MPVTVDIFLATPILAQHSVPPVRPDRMRHCYRLTLNSSRQIADEEILQQAFQVLNVNHPSDYLSRSLSAGDVVTLDGARSYVCDAVGWKRLDFALQSIHAVGRSRWKEFDAGKARLPRRELIHVAGLARPV